MTQRLLILLALTSILCACGSIQRSDDAASAKVAMIGMAREDVLGCMGPARKKASEGTIEVWSYASGGSSGQSQGGSLKTGSLTTHSTSHDRDYCIVNIVMKNGVVTAVNYNGPSDSLFAPNEQCGYAVVNCVSANRF